MTTISYSTATPTVQFIEVTPDMAEKWLTENNVGNRRISQSTVDRYAIDMSLGLWRQRTGEPLIFDRNGRLQQGQHRLAALVRSGSTLTFMVVYNADPDDFAVLDQGKKRLASDILGMQGLPNAKLVASISRVTLLLIEHPADYWAGVKDVTQQRIIAWASQHEAHALWATQVAGQARANALVPESQYGAVALYVRLHSQSMAGWNDFHQRVVSGEMLKDGDPEFALRRWALNRKAISGSSSSQANTAIIAKAWNAYAKDKVVRTLMWKRHEMPMPIPLPSN